MSGPMLRRARKGDSNGRKGDAARRACHGCNVLALPSLPVSLHRSARCKRATPERGPHDRETWDDVVGGGTLSKSRLEWLQEAAALEALGSEWQTGHAAAFCGLSTGALLRSDCPRRRVCGERSTKGRGRLVFTPSVVRQWFGQRAAA